MNHSNAIIVFFVGIVLTISACQPQEKKEFESKGIDTVAIKTAIADLGAVVQRAHDTKDYKLLGTTWAKDGIFTVTGNPPIMGREAIISAFSNMPAPPPDSKMSMNLKEIQVLNENWAYVFGIDSLTYTPTGSKVPIKETSTFFVLVRKGPEGWQSYREMLSQNQMPKN